MRVKEGVFEGVKTRNVYHCATKNTRIVLGVAYTKAFNDAILSRANGENRQVCQKVQRLCGKRFGQKKSHEFLVGFDGADPDL
jgi:hypothetical protein